MNFIGVFSLTVLAGLLSVSDLGAVAARKKESRPPNPPTASKTNELSAASATSRVATKSLPRLSKEIRYPEGKLKEKYSYYIDDKKHEIRDGMDEEFYPSGAKKGQITWEDGHETGTVIYYFADGRKSYEANYIDGKKNGFSTVWYQSGQKQWQTVFHEGLTNGVWREWYSDGKRKFEANYNDGKLEGLATWWHENGHIWQERSYQSGLQVKGSVREWDKVGRQTYPPLDSGADGDGLPVEPANQDSSAGKEQSASP